MEILKTDTRSSKSGRKRRLCLAGNHIYNGNMRTSTRQDRRRGHNQVMPLNWIFTKKTAGERTRDPVTSEFFSQKAIKNAGEALIREAVQNSLDARKDRKNGKARIRIYVSGAKGALSPERHKHWFGSAWSHYEAEKNGLRPNTIGKDIPCRFLVFEDFETKGLIGDRMQYEVKPGVKNSFFYFFRAEGATEKDADRLGRWGIGKQVFPRSSKAQSLFGYTETDEGAFLMGSCILKHHAVEGVTYRPDGYLATKTSLPNGENLAMPTSDTEELQRFRRDFSIARLPGEHGLSVVVPWLDEGEDGSSVGFSSDAMCLSLIEGYFAPILEGRLEAEIEEDSEVTRINASTFDETLSNLLQKTTDERRIKEIKRAMSHIKLAQAAKARDVITYTLKDPLDFRAAWTPEMLSEADALQMRKQLEDGKILEINVKAPVRAKKPKSDTLSEFTCYIAKQEGLNDKPCHIREDLIISGVDCKRVNGHACLIRIPAGPLGNLLGDSENPAHTEWDKDSQNFQGKYVLGNMTINFVSDFGVEIVRRIQANSKQLDRNLLTQFFNDPGPERPEPGVPVTPPVAPRTPTPPVPPPPLPPIPLPRQKQVRIVETDGGFEILPNGLPLPIGSTLQIQLAYVVGRGNPFRKYDANDFDLSKLPIMTELKGLSVVEMEKNEALLTITDPEFRFSASGFDLNRDLIIDADVTALA